MEADAAASGLGLDVARAGLLELDIAGACAEGCWSLDAVGPDGPGAALRFDIGSYVLNFDVAGAGDGRDGGGVGKGDVVIDADVAIEIVVVVLADPDDYLAIYDEIARLLDADGWEAATAGDYFTRWSAEGYLNDDVLEPDATAAAILAVLDDAASPDDIMVKAGG